MSSNIGYMNIIEKNLEGFKDKISNSKLDYPKSDNNNLFNLFFNMMAVGARGSGKTYSTVKIIKEYEKSKMISAQGEHKIRTILISPTYDANKNLWGNLKSLDENDIYEEYSESTLKTIIEDIKQIIDEIDIYNKYLYYYDLIDKTPKNEIQALLKSNPEISFILKNLIMKLLQKLKNILDIPLNQLHF
jgi:Cdc6-like AAA superfamily ATPase